MPLQLGIHILFILAHFVFEATQSQSLHLPEVKLHKRPIMRSIDFVALLCLLVQPYYAAPVFSESIQCHLKLMMSK